MQFEYTYLREMNKYKVSEIEPILNKWGLEGWELVTFQVDCGVGTYIVFKRKM